VARRWDRGHGEFAGGSAPNIFPQKGGKYKIKNREINLYIHIIVQQKSTIAIKNIVTKTPYIK
jgi:hypothetical protein